MSVTGNFHSVPDTLRNRVLEAQNHTYEMP